MIAPDDAAYDQARTIFYGGIDRRPAVIVRPTDASDVAQVVSIARDTGLELAVRSGGHSLAGHSTTDGGIMLDLVGMHALDIDPTQRTAWAQTGLTAGAYTTAAGAHGLATGFGDTGSVGIGGITLGGGIGLLVRKHGLTIDDLLAAELVTADGQLLQVDDQTHPELFWAIRGGGGNFGVATRFRFRPHPLDQIVGGMLLLPAIPDTIAAFVAEAEAAPEELSSRATSRSSTNWAGPTSKSAPTVRSAAIGSCCAARSRSAGRPGSPSTPPNRPPPSLPAAPTGAARGERTDQPRQPARGGLLAGGAAPGARLADPWVVLGRWWRAWSTALPPAQLRLLLDRAHAGRPLHLYLPP